MLLNSLQDPNQTCVELAQDLVYYLEKVVWL